MRHYRLTNQERAGSGFTDQFVIDGKELTEAATTQTINLVTLTSALVDDLVVVRLDEKFTGPSGTLKLEVGTSGDPDYHVAITADLKAGAVGLLHGTATTAAGVANRYGTIISSSTVNVVKFTSSSGNLSATTNTGQVSIFMRIVQSDDLGYDQS
jgi:hypothetical protein